MQVLQKMWQLQQLLKYEKKFKDHIFLLVLQRTFNGIYDMSNICEGYFRTGTVFILYC